MTEIKFRSLEEWTVGEAAAALGATSAPQWSDRPFARISTDSRSIEPGDFFLALAGENFDGHDYLDRALESGAGGLIVSRPCAAEVPVLQVPDTLAAYGRLAAELRRAWGGVVIALSGSVGKTTTRRLVASALRSRVKTLEPMRNFNNLIGLPATLARLQADHRIAVLELGMNRRGELKRLTEIASPDVAGLTRIGRAHMGMFGSAAELIEAKLELFAGARAGAPLVVNAACSATMGSIARFEADHPIVRFAATPHAQAEVKIENVRPIAPVGYRFDLSWPGGKLEGLRLVHFGRHALEDVAAAAALLLAADHEIDLIVDALEGFATEPLRGQVIEAGPWTFIMDCYNAAPESMRGAIEALADLPAAGRTIVVLADMLELGEGSRAEHEALAAPIAALAPAAFFGLGDEMSRLAEVLATSGMAAHGASDRDELTERLGDFLLPGDRVYFKGARRFALEEVARRLAPRAPILSETTVLTRPADAAGNVDRK